MAELIEVTRATIERYGLLSGGEAVVVGVSGGADSTALLHVLSALAPAYRLRLHVAHLHHGLRHEAEEDAAFVARLADGLGIPGTFERADVAALARAGKRSIEEAGRLARYEFFSRTARSVGADRIAVGHTRDDQIETVLMRLLQGAPWELLAGMRPHRAGPPVVIRPLLEASRSAARAFLQNRGLAWREDPTNLDLTIPRNHLRHTVLPALQTRHPAWPELLWRIGETARLCAETLDRLSEGLYGHLRSAGADGVALALDPLRALPSPVGRRVLRRATADAAGTSRPVPRVLEDRMLHVVAAGRPGTEVVGGGTVLRIGYGVVEIGRALPAPFRGEYRLNVPGEVRAAAFEVVFTAALEPAREPTDDPAEAVLDAACVESPLTVRSWRPGDVFRPLGLTGKKKLQDYFVDAKVPRWRRRLIPLVVDARGEVVWVVGHRIAEPCRVRPETQRTLRLRVRPA
jgi:tRNA(Ile)-lysidine synthase